MIWVELLRESTVFVDYDKKAYERLGQNLLCSLLQNESVKRLLFLIADGDYLAQASGLQFYRLLLSTLAPKYKILQRGKAHVNGRSRTKFLYEIAIKSCKIPQKSRWESVFRPTLFSRSGQRAYSWTCQGCIQESARKALEAVIWVTFCFRC